MKYTHVYEHLNSVKPEFTVVPTTAQVRQVISSISQGDNLEVTLETLPGWETKDVARLVEGLGKFISQSTKTKVDATVFNWELSGCMFFAPSLKELDTERAQKAINPSSGLQGGSTNFIPDGTDLTTPVVFLPPGWTKGEIHKSLAQSFATVVLTPLSDDVIERFLNRAYAQQDIAVGAEHVHLLLWLCEHDLLNKLIELEEENYSLVNVLARAWQSLLVWSDEGWESFQSLARSATQEQWDLEELIDHCSRASWMWPAEITRVKQALTQVLEDPTNVALLKLAGMRIANFAIAARTGGYKRVIVPEGLNAAQVHALCITYGLTGHEDAEKTVRRELRDWLSERGLANDLDKEIARGVTAWRAGTLDEFYLSLTERVNGTVKQSGKVSETVA